MRRLFYCMPHEEPLAVVKKQKNVWKVNSGTENDAGDTVDEIGGKSCIASGGGGFSKRVDVEGDEGEMIVQGTIRLVPITTKLSFTPLLMPPEDIDLGLSSAKSKSGVHKHSRVTNVRVTMCHSCSTGGMLVEPFNATTISVIEKKELNGNSEGGMKGLETRENGDRREGDNCIDDGKKRDVDIASAKNIMDDMVIPFSWDSSSMKGPVHVVGASAWLYAGIVEYDELYELCA